MYDEQESREPELAPDLAALDRQLRGMTPTAPRVDRDRLMFAAGQAAGASAKAESGRDGRAMYDESGRPIHIAGPFRAGSHFWPAATFTMTAAALLLATMLVWQNRWQPIAQQIVPVQPTVVASETVHSFDADRSDRLAARNRWQSIPSVNSGYLGVRYVALTRGIGALSEIQSSDSDDEAPTDDRANSATPRGLLQELLPTAHLSNSSRS